MWNMVSLYCQNFKLVGTEIHLGFNSNQVILEMGGRRFYLQANKSATFVYKTQNRIFGNLNEHYLFVADDLTEIYLEGYFMFANINGFQQMFRDAVKRVLPLFKEALEQQNIVMIVDRISQNDGVTSVDSQEINEMMRELDKHQIRAAMDRALTVKDYETAKRLFPLWNHNNDSNRSAKVK